MLTKRITKNFKETQKLGENAAKKIIKNGSRKTAVVLALSGDLGGGKTTFLQGFARGLGIREKILSPTFVIQKRFELKNKKLKNFYHIDCYRLKNNKPARNASHSDAGRFISEINVKEIIKNPENIVAIEWPEKIKKFIPKNTIFINFKLIDKNKREMMFSLENDVWGDIINE